MIIPDGFELDICLFLRSSVSHLCPYLKGLDTKKLLNMVNRTSERIMDLDSSSLNYGWIHGDLVQWNVHFDQKGEIGFFDFDMLSKGNRAFELSQFLHEALYLNAGPKEFKSFLKSYSSTIALSEEDLSLIDLLLPWRSIWHLSQMAVNSQEWGNESLREQDFLKEKLNFTYKIYNHKFCQSLI